MSVIRTGRKQISKEDLQRGAAITAATQLMIAQSLVSNVRSGAGEFLRDELRKRFAEAAMVLEEVQRELSEHY